MVFNGNNILFKNNVISNLNDYKYKTNKDGVYPMYRWLTLRGKNIKIKKILE